MNNVDVKQLGKVAVLMGGTAAEREVSLKSGQAVLAALLEQGVDAEGIDVVSVEQLLDVAKQYDRVFNVVHGRWGEDGGIQAVLDALDVPYTGSEQAASALTMDKLRTKWLWQGAGISTPEFIYVTEKHPLIPEDFQIPFPVIVKPSHEGSSIGMRKVESLSELVEAVNYAQEFDQEVLVERWITGREFTCAILDGDALPLIELRTSHSFYDYDAKYLANDTQYLCPTNLPADQEAAIQKLCLQAFEIAGTRDWGRLDLLMDKEENVWLIELNTVPGMTDHSLVPMAAKAKGIEFGELVVKLLTLTLQHSH